MKYSLEPRPQLCNNDNDMINTPFKDNLVTNNLFFFGSKEAKRPLSFCQIDQQDTTSTASEAS